MDKSIKILSTIGEITSTNNNLKKLINHSDVVRTNASHNTIKWHENISKQIKKINSEKLHLLDIPGVKPRTANKSNINIKKNQLICFYYNNNYLPKNIIKIRLTKPLPKTLNKPHHFSISDGQYTFKLIKFNKNYIIGKSYSTFELFSHKGLNIPNSVYDDKLQLNQYKKFLLKCKNVKYDAIGLSFIQSKDVIEKIRKLYKDKIIISKIENLYGMKNLREIVKTSDGIMIDRGDLSAEVGSQKLFDSVIKISSETKNFGKPLIMATENLESMITKNEPTKSEIMSLDFNLHLGADFIMLSDETATSSNWLNTLKWLENHQSQDLKSNNEVIKNRENSDQEFSNKVLSECNFDTNAPFIFVSNTGASIKEFKKKYKNNKCYVFTDSLKTKNLCYLWKDVKPFFYKSLGSINRGKDVLRMIKKNEKEIFKKNVNFIICIFILNPIHGSKANSIYIVTRNDLKQVT